MAPPKSTGGLNRRIPIPAWNGPLYGLSDSAKLTWFYLATGPESTPIPGLAMIGIAGIAEALGWPPGRAKQAADELTRTSALLAEWPRRLAYLPHVAQMAPPDNPAQVQGWRLYWGTVPACPTKHQIAAAIRRVLERRGPEYTAMFDAYAGDVDGDVRGDVPPDVATDVGGDVPTDVPDTGKEEEKEREKEEEKDLPRTPKRSAKQLTANASIFRDAYPPHRRGAAKDIATSWRSNDCEASADVIIASLAGFKASHEWRKDGGTFVPKAAKFLNEEQWKHAPLQSPGHTGHARAENQDHSVLGKVAI